MQLRIWLLIVRILNCISALMMVGFEIWFFVALILSDRNLFGLILAIWAPVFIILLAIVIVTSQFKYQKIVENFKFLQWMPGLAFFNLFIASIMAFEFVLISDTIAIVLASLFIGEAIGFSIMHCLRPVGSGGLLSQD